MEGQTDRQAVTFKRRGAGVAVRVSRPKIRHGHLLETLFSFYLFFFFFFLSLSGLFSPSLINQ